MGIEPLKNPNDRLTPNGHVEGGFRREVRSILDLDIFTRDYLIFERLRDLVRLERAQKFIQPVEAISHDKG